MIRIDRILLKRIITSHMRRLMFVHQKYVANRRVSHQSRIIAQHMRNDDTVVLRREETLINAFLLCAYMCAYKQYFNIKSHLCVDAVDIVIILSTFTAPKLSISQFCYAQARSRCVPSMCTGPAYANRDIHWQTPTSTLSMIDSCVIHLFKHY